MLYKRDAKGAPIFWDVEKFNGNFIRLHYGVVGSVGHYENIVATRDIDKEIQSLIKAKRKTGYKALEDLYDNAPTKLSNANIKAYLETYLPKYNTHDDGKFIPMLCKTLKDDKPFTKSAYFGQWKINGERCIITMQATNDMFSKYRLTYRSREGVDWTSKLNYLDEYFISIIPDELKELMVEEGAALDGELYIPGYGINEINSFIKNVEMPQHYRLQFWCYDICMLNATAFERQSILHKHFAKFCKNIKSKEEHYGNTKSFIMLPFKWVEDINEAINHRDEYISLGFEGLVIRDCKAEYQFGGKRNNSMLKFKKKLDGLFYILDIIPEGIKRDNLPKFVCKNDINEATFECNINKPQDEQRLIFRDRHKYIGKKLLVEYRERSGVLEVPFHARGINIV